MSSNSSDDAERQNRRIMGPRPEWRTSTNGNAWVRHGNYRSVICQDRRGHFGYLIAKGDAKGTFTKVKFATEEEAKLAAWDALLDLHGDK